MYETWEECAIREVKEETNLDIYQVSFGCVTNDPMVAEGKHYVTVFMTAEVLEEEGITVLSPENMEPHKCDGWSSFSWDDLCRLQKEGKLFSPLNRMVVERPPAIINFMQRPKSLHKK
jgi:8-oxo-dGTP diphosphatase